MAVREIITEGHPVLRQKAKEVPKITKRVAKLIDDMLETMEEANGAGLAAPQIGVSQRIIVLAGLEEEEEPLILINPVITEASGDDIDVEGCLSVPGRWVYVKRHTHLKIEGLTEKGKRIRLETEGFLARALQHEIDHLDGVLIIDRMVDEAPEPSGEKEGE